MPALVPGSLSVLLLYSVFGPASLYLASTFLKTFNRALLAELLRRSTSSKEHFYPFLPLVLLSNKTNRKQTFDIVFINSRLFADNHAQEEIDLSFAECGCLIVVKLNQSWQMELLDLKPVYIIKVIPFATTIFLKLLFVLYYCYIVKLLFKSGLKTRDIAYGIVKKRIELV